MISAVTIDLWQTLIVDPAHNLTNGRRFGLDAVRRLLAQSGHPVDPETLERGYEESGRRLTKIWGGAQDISSSEQVALFLDSIETGLGASLPRHLLTEIEEAYTGPALRFPPVLAPGAAYAIEALRNQGLVLGIVSNTGRTPGAILRQVLGRYGLFEKFAVLTFPDEARVRKPDPRIFQQVLEALACRPSEAVHVGDDLEADVGGATGAGMRAIHLSQNSHPSSAAATVRSLFELPEAVARL